MKEEKDIKDNTSLIVIIMVVLIAVIGIIVFMLLGNDKGDSRTINDDRQQQADTVTMSDVAGKYYGEHTATNSDEVDNDNDHKTSDGTNDKSDDRTNNNQSGDTADNKSDGLLDDAKDAVDDAADSVTNNDESFRIELDLDSDGTGRIVNTLESKEVLEGTYTLANRMITFVINVDDDNTSVKTTSYMFTVNSDKSLTYNRIGNNFILTKASSDDLKYIK